MSLTSHIADKSSHVHKFLEEHLPNTNSKSAHTNSLERLRIKNDQTNLDVEVSGEGGAEFKIGEPLVMPATRENYPWPIVGTAFDYRLRYFLEVTPTEELVASKGAYAVRMHFQSDDLPKAFQELHSELDRLAPELGKGILSSEKELFVAQLCVALAQYEACFRAQIRDNWPVIEIGENGSLAELLELCPDEVANDLNELASLFYRTHIDFINRTPRVLNPNFVASRFLGGADADLILGNRLIDIKTVQKVRINRDYLWQLAGYVLADLDNNYEIEEVGFYFSRHGQQLSWKVGDYFNYLAGHPVDISELRLKFGDLVESKYIEASKAFGIRVEPRKPAPKK